MFPDIFVYSVHLPAGINEIVTPCLDGYTVYINEELDLQARIKAYQHAVKHILSSDFEDDSVQNIESLAHGRRYA